MSLILSIDPGLNTGVALAYFDDVTPYTLRERWQVHGGPVGLDRWLDAGGFQGADVLVVEKFILARNDFAADLTPVQDEGVIMAAADRARLPILWQPRSDKGRLTGYSEKAKAGTKTQRQRERFDFLERFGMYAAGTENDDSNDAITHGLVYLKRIEHLPTLRHFWPPRRKLTA